MVNRYTQFTPLTFDLYKPDVGVMASLAEGLQKRYDANFEAAESLRNTLINSLPQDRIRANEKQAEYSKKIDNVVAAYNGDYSQATKDLYRLKKEIERDFAPGGEAHAIQTNYLTYVDWDKRQKERVAKEQVSSSDLTAATNYFMNSFAGTKSDEYGVYSKINLQEVANTVNIDKIVRDVAAGMKPEKIERGNTVFKNGLKIDIVEAQEGVSYERLSPSLKLALSSDPNIANYFSQKMLFSGADPSLARTYLEQYADARAKDLSYLSTKSTSFKERDSLALEQYRQNREDQRKQMELFGNRQFEAIPTTGSIYKEIDPYDFATQKPKASFEGFMQSMKLTPESFSSAGSEASFVFPGVRVRDRQQNIVAAANNPGYLERFKINGTLLKANINENIQRLNSDPAKALEIYNSKYGKDAAWTKSFDEQVINQYNTDFKNNALTEPMVMPLGGKQGDAVVEDLYSALKTRPEHVRVMKLGSRDLISASDAGITAEDLVVANEKGANPKLTSDVNYVVPQPNVYTGGIMIVKNGETYVIEDQSEERRTISRQVGSAFKEINAGETRSSQPILIGNRNGQNIYGLPEVVYERGADKTMRSYHRYALVDPATGNVATDASGEEIFYRPNSPLDLWRNYRSFDEYIQPTKTK
jgi:hypothetical protein